MNAVGVIPARWASNRFEGKVLADINGKPLIQHVFERAKEARLLDDLIIACDDERVMQGVKKFGGKAYLTSQDQPSGTDRIAEAVNDIDVKIVVNIQGDEPMINGVMIDSLVSVMLEHRKVQMATLVKKIKDKHEISDPNIVKVVVDKKGDAIYFSRCPIPYNRENMAVTYFKHIGLYAYTKDFLFEYTKLPFSALEHAEKLEQLRVLEHGFRIKTVETEYDTVGVDTPDDLKKVKKLLEK